MADDLRKRGKVDRDRIAYEQEYERSHFCQQMRCTETELLLAIWACLSDRRAHVRETIQEARRILKKTRAQEKRARARKRRAKATLRKRSAKAG